MAIKDLEDLAMEVVTPMGQLVAIKWRTIKVGIFFARKLC